MFPANIFGDFDWRLSIENRGKGVQSRIGDRQSRVTEWEVLPPEDRSRSQRTSASLESRFRWLALIMDDFLRVPGTKLRFGLDPIIGLLLVIVCAGLIVTVLVLEGIGRFLFHR